ncbi:MAG: hypothetical protein WC670_01540 [Pseudolabrys sp.]|jgi:hypothetical protein
MGKHVIDCWPSAPDEWSGQLQQDFQDNIGNGRVGSRLVSISDRVRVWHLSLRPGERIGFHTHVLDYFWTAITAGTALSHYSDGRSAEAIYSAGDTKHYTFSAGNFIIHDLQNVGETELVFATVEFLDSANAPLSLTVEREAWTETAL